MKRMLKPETIQKRVDFTFRRMEARLVGYNFRYADQFVSALRVLNEKPSLEAFEQLSNVMAKMLR